MKLKYRLVIIIAFIIIFTILSPLIIFYAQGYRYDIGRGRIVKTGVFFINSNPRSALVAIDGHSYLPNWYNQILFYKELFGLPKSHGLTPTIISNLIPNKYLITVEKPNYQVWQKKLEIISETTTSASGIQLFLKEPAVELIVATPDNAWLSPNKNKLVFTEQNLSNQILLKLVNDLSDQPKISNLLSLPANKIKNIQWSSDNNNIVIDYQFNNRNRFLIFDLLSPERSIYLRQIIKFEPQKIQWSLNNPNILYLQNNNDIYVVDLKTSNLKSFFNLNFLPYSQLLDWQINGRHLLWLRKNIQGLYLEKSPLKENSKEYTKNDVIFSLALPVNSAHFTSIINHNFIALTSGENFYLINVDSQEPEKNILFKNQAKNIAWQTNKQKLLFYNDFELSTVQLSHNQTDSLQINYDVIYRSSEKISQAEWHASNEWILYLTDNKKLQIIEIDSRDMRNNFNLLKTEQIYQFWTTDKPGLIYVRGKINNQEGIFKLQLQ